MVEVTREELAAMTDQELSASEREHYGDPYMTLLQAKGMQRVALQLWHVGAARKEADREARAEARRRLHQKLLPSGGQAPYAGPACRKLSRPGASVG